MVLYKSKLQLASDTIEIDGVTYTCAGTSAPILINNERFYLYYTKNTGAVPGVPIREITIDEIPLISGAATNLCGGEGSQELYGNVNQPTFIHLHYDQDDIEFYNKLYVGHGVNERAAMCDLLAQGCVQYVDLDMNTKADGDTVLPGYRSGCQDWEAINKLSGSARQSELVRQEKEAIYDIILTNDEPYASFLYRRLHTRGAAHDTGGSRPHLCEERADHVRSRGYAAGKLLKGAGKAAPISRYFFSFLLIC